MKDEIDLFVDKIDRIVSNNTEYDSIDNINDKIVIENTNNTNTNNKLKLSKECNGYIVYNELSIKPDQYIIINYEMKPIYMEMKNMTSHYINDNYNDLTHQEFVEEYIIDFIESLDQYK